MAVVVDSCCVHHVFRHSRCPVLFRWLEQRGRLAICPKLVREYRQAGVFELVREFERQGRLVSRSSAAIEREMASEAMKKCVSDDQEIIALMRLTGVRLVCTRDERLGRDVQNRELVNKPPGKLYPLDEERKKKNSLRRLLERYGSCGDS